MIDCHWELVYYVARNGKIPYREWFESLSDFKAQAVIDSRLARIRLGNFGTSKPIGAGIFELKIYYGPGYRIYFTKTAGRIVLLLLGGDKSTQRKDIQTAIQYWQEYKERIK